MLNHPPGIELVLRKRICLRVVKKVGGFSFMKLFTPAVIQSETGAMYEVVTGIPKVSGQTMYILYVRLIVWFGLVCSWKECLDRLKFPQIILRLLKSMKMRISLKNSRIE